MTGVRLVSALAGMVALLLITQVAWSQAGGSKSAPATQDEFPKVDELVARLPAADWSLSLRPLPSASSAGDRADQRDAADALTPKGTTIGRPAVGPWP